MSPGKKSDLQRAIDSINDEITVLEGMRDRLVALSAAKPAAPKRTSKPKPGPAEVAKP